MKNTIYQSIRNKLLADTTNLSYIIIIHMFPLYYIYIYYLGEL